MQHLLLRARIGEVHLLQAQVSRGGRGQDRGHGRLLQDRPDVEVLEQLAEVKRVLVQLRGLLNQFLPDRLHALENDEEQRKVAHAVAALRSLESEITKRTEESDGREHRDQAFGTHPATPDAELFRPDHLAQAHVLSLEEPAQDAYAKLLGVHVGSNEPVQIGRFPLDLGAPPAPVVHLAGEMQAHQQRRCKHHGKDQQHQPVDRPQQRDRTRQQQAVFGQHQDVGRHLCRPLPPRGSRALQRVEIARAFEERQVQPDGMGLDHPVDVIGQMQPLRLPHEARQGPRQQIDERTGGREDHGVHHWLDIDLSWRSGCGGRGDGVHEPLDQIERQQPEYDLGHDRNRAKHSPFPRTGPKQRQDALGGFQGGDDFRGIDHEMRVRCVLRST